MTTTRRRDPESGAHLMNRTCRISRYLTAYLDGELSPRRRRRVEEHLARCRVCSAELDSLRASDRILGMSSPPPVSDDRWRVFDRELHAALDRVDREATRARKVREARPVERLDRRVAWATAGVAVAAVLVALALGPGAVFRGLPEGGNECFVDSIESYTAGYTPMFFTSDDPQMTVIWVFAEQTGPGAGQDGIGAR